MEMRRLGETPLTVSALGLGLAALGRPGYMTVGHAEDIGDDASAEAMEARCHRVLDLAWEAGVRYFDTARSYGRGEAFLSRWLAARRIPPGEVTVGSKWGYVYTAGWERQADRHEVKIHTVDNFRRQWDETQALLGAHLSLYMIHSATLESGVLERPGLLAEMRRACDEGGVQMGLSLSSARQPAVLRRALALGCFDVVEATWNVLEPSAGASLQEARSRGMGVIVKEALANGRLTSRDAALAARAAEQGAAPLDAHAIAAAMAQPFADVVLSGAATPAQLRANLGALTTQPADLAGWAEEPAAYWRRRSGLAWS